MRLTKDQRQTWERLIKTYKTIFEDTENVLYEAIDALEDLDCQLQEHHDGLQDVGEDLVQFALNITDDIAAEQEDLDEDSKKHQRLATMFDHWEQVANADFDFDQSIPSISRIHDLVDLTPEDLHRIPLKTSSGEE